MKNCPKCGGLNPEESIVCSNCGSSLTTSGNDFQNLATPSVDIQYTDNYSNLNSDSSISASMEVGSMDDNGFQNINEDNNQVYQEPNYEDGPSDFNSSNMKSSNVILNEEDERFVDSYIGKNSEKVKKTKTSIWAFFFGPLYLWYRKMYKLFGIVLGVNLLINIVFYMLDMPVAIIIAEIVINVALSFKFQEFYLKHVNNSIQKIKNDNQDKNEEDIINICSKKGGTTIIPVIFGGVLALGIIAAVIASILGTPRSGNNSAVAKSTMVDSANLIIEAVRIDVTNNNLNANSKTYDIDAINELLESPIETSPYGVMYTDIQVQATKMLNGNYIYKICMIDESNNGFGYTYENSLSTDIVLEGNAPDSCSE